MRRCAMLKKPSVLSKIPYQNFDLPRCSKPSFLFDDLVENVSHHFPRLIVAPFGALLFDSFGVASLSSLEAINRSL